MNWSDFGIERLKIEVTAGHMHLLTEAYRSTVRRITLSQLCFEASVEEFIAGVSSFYLVCTVFSYRPTP